MKTEVVLNAIAIILFLGFGMASFIAFSTIDKQKEINIPSRYGRHTQPLDIVYVNVGIILVAVMLAFHSYRFLPALVVFLFLILLNSRMQSGIAPLGVFIGTTFLAWDDIKEYRIVNDEISTVKVLVYSNQKCYVLRCDKTCRMEIESYFEDNHIIKKINEEEETNHEAFN